MGFALMMCHCVACKSMVACNPNKVPSVTVNGRREPLCRACVEKWKALHPESNFEIPEGAYEPCDESEL